MTKEFNRIDNELINLKHLLHKPITKKISRIADKKFRMLEASIENLLSVSEYSIDNATVYTLKNKLGSLKEIKIIHALLGTWP